MSSGILPSFLGALQASLAVLLTIGYGAIAARFNLLKESSAKDISKVCVRLFLPALLITNVGSELHADTAHRYAPVLSKLHSFPRSSADKAAMPQRVRLILSGLFHNADRILHSLGVDVYIIVHASRMDIEATLQVASMDRTRDMLQQYNCVAFAADPITRRGWHSQRSDNGLR